jgi:signal transduction histidine kinase
LLAVADDGVGVLEEKIDAPTSLGLFGMRERAAQLGGQFDIRRGTPCGTVVTIRIPLPPTTLKKA